MLPKRVTEALLPAASASRAIPLSARPQTEGSGLCFVGTPRPRRVPPNKAALDGRELDSRPLGEPTPPGGEPVMDTASEPIESAAVPAPITSYERWASVFSRVHAEVGSIAIALEVLDTYRAREALRPRPIDIPRRILALAAGAFHVPVHRLLERDRHRDVADARYAAAWVLRRRRWAYEKIAELLKLDHSTVIHGLRKVAAHDYLLLAASKAEQLLELELNTQAAGGPM